MKTYLIADTHFNHGNIATYCDRPADFTQRIIKNWQATVKPQDLVIHLGDVAIGKRQEIGILLSVCPGRKVLIRGNHDRQSSCGWWMEHGFDFACDSMIFRRQWLTHEPADSLPIGCTYNLHGHLHNIWHGFMPEGKALEPQTRLHTPWQRLFAIEYTDYRPVEFDKFVNHPNKYQAKGRTAGKQGQP